MLDIIKKIFIVFFIINAIFWSLFSHHTHCKLVSNLSIECPSHSLHLIIGIASFFIALIIAQYDYIKYKLN